MRRKLFLLTLLLTGATAGASAQAKIRLSATLDSATRQPVLQLSNLFGATPWKEAIDASWPLRITWKVELWRVGYFLGARVDKRMPDSLGGEWTYLIQRQSTLNLYHLVQSTLGHPARDAFYKSLDSLNSKEFGGPLKPKFNRPTGTGASYYYSITVEIKTMNADEVRKMLAELGGGSSVLDVMVGTSIIPSDKLGPVQTVTFKVP